MKRLSLELSDLLYEAMDKAISKNGLSKSEYIRSAIYLINLVALDGYEVLKQKNDKEKSVYIPGISGE